MTASDTECRLMPTRKVTLRSRRASGGSIPADHSVVFISVSERSFSTQRAVRRLASDRSGPGAASGTATTSRVEDRTRGGCKGRENVARNSTRDALRWATPVLELRPATQPVVDRLSATDQARQGTARRGERGHERSESRSGPLTRRATSQRTLKNAPGPAGT